MICNGQNPMPAFGRMTKLWIPCLTSGTGQGLMSSYTEGSSLRRLSLKHAMVLLDLYFVYRCLASVYVCTAWVPGAHRGQKRASGSLRLESDDCDPPWGLGLELRSSGRTASALNL